jgi:hypothetical protein
LTQLDVTFGPTLTYDFDFNGPITPSRSFADDAVYALVLDRFSRVDEDAVRTAVESLALRVRVIMLRSCTSQAALRRVRRGVDALATVRQPGAMGVGLSPALGAVSVTVNNPDFAAELRERYGNRVKVFVGEIHLE